MRAIVCSQYGSPDLLELQQRDSQPLAAGQLRVAVKTVGVNYVDGLLVAGSYQIKVPTPFVPGSDLAGVVSEVGEGVEGFAIGDRVLASTGVGALCDELLLQPAQLTRIPDAMTDAVGATFLQANGTAYFGLVDCGRIQPGETLLVLGASGGTGMAAIHIAKALGARVIAAASSEDKLAACRDAGADETINYLEEDLKIRAKELSGGRGVDLVFDPVGADLAEAALRACAPGARYLVIGFVGGPIPKMPLNLPLLKRCSIVGVNWGASFMDDASLLPVVHGAILQLFSDGKLPAPPISEFALEDSALAIERLHSRQLTGRAVVRLAN